ncbi:hypothetical protein [Komagataeibacter europaeus]|uniref:hypothetical protein n=1 Tax=Komagataeibacter europaeus TaxID=33995 RepID=UPI001E5460E1|nr:hypothetical protein [Komagataeibacter europaeus]
MDSILAAGRNQSMGFGTGVENRSGIMSQVGHKTGGACVSLMFREGSSGSIGSKPVRSCALMLAFFLTLGPAHARSPSLPAESVPVPPTFAALESAAAKAKAVHCGTDDCKSMILLDYLVRKVVVYEAGEANGVASIRGTVRRDIAGRRLDYHFLSHRGLYGPMCAFSIRYLQNIKAPQKFGDPLYAGFVPMQIFLDAVDMDFRDGGHCAEQLAPFFLNTKAGQQVRHDTFEFCINGYENHPRPVAACNLIADDKVPSDKGDHQ